MNKKYLIIVLLIFISVIFITPLASKRGFSFNAKGLFSNKTDKVLSDFDSNYEITTTINKEEKEYEEEIKELTKKATYLFLGNFNGEEESAEDYYKRHEDLKKMRYAPEIPKDENDITGYDTNSTEYIEDSISGFSMGSVFKQVQEAKIIYHSYGDISISESDDVIYSKIIIPDIKIRIQSETNPEEYEYQKTDLQMNYYFKKLNGEYKISYVWGIFGDEVTALKKAKESQEISKSISITNVINSNLEKIYDFSKLNNVSDEKLNEIYNNNVNNFVFLKGYYDANVNNIANGFYIGDGLVITTWDFLEKSLVNSQYIVALNSNFKKIDIEGIVTVSPENNIAIIKVAKTNPQINIANENNLKIEDPIFEISSTSGLGTTIQKGIVIANDDYIKTSISSSVNEQGSPLYNIDGQIVGINVSSDNSDINKVLSSIYLKEIIDKFKDVNYDSIKAISFADLKEKYYYTKIDEEKISNDIPKRIWKKYSKIGDIKNSIKLDLVKASYKDNIVSLRYKNNASEYISNMSLATKFIDNLKKDNYKETIISDKKYIYQNDKYKVVILSEFDYLIVVVVKL